MAEDTALHDKIARARQLLAEIHHVSISTVNEDGSPHQSPVFMAFDDELNGYWSSHPDSLHSRNITRGGRVFFVVFDSKEGHGGLFVEASARQLKGREQAELGYQALKRLKEQFYGTMGNIDMYLDGGPQRIYVAEPIRFWVNKSDRNAEGAIIRDRRYEVALADLLQ